MTITDFKDLQKLIKLCQTGKVKSIQVDNIVLELSESAFDSKPKRYKQVKAEPHTIGIGVDETIQIPQSNTIETDELTDEQLLFYSAVPKDQQV